MENTELPSLDELAQATAPKIEDFGFVMLKEDVDGSVTACFPKDNECVPLGKGDEAFQSSKILLQKLLSDEEVV